MQIIKPIVITEADFVTNVVETNPTWSSSTSYSKDARVVYNNSIYESLVNTNLNKIPSSSPLDWILIGPSNKFAVFDTSYSTKSTRNDFIQYVISFTQIANSLAILNMNSVGGVLNINQYDPGANLIYSKSIVLDGTPIVDYYDYFFAPFSQLQDVVVTDLPPFTDSYVEVSITGTGPISIGCIIVGTSERIGYTQYGLSFGIRDYSLKEENDYGDIVLTERNYANRVEPTVDIRNTDIRKISALLKSIRATPTVFVPSDSDDLESLVTYGFISDWNIDVTYPQHSLLRLEIKGLT